LIVRNRHTQRSTQTSHAIIESRVCGRSPCQRIYAKTLSPPKATIGAGTYGLHPIAALCDGVPTIYIHDGKEPTVTGFARTEFGSIVPAHDGDRTGRQFRNRPPT